MTGAFCTNGCCDPNKTNMQRIVSSNSGSGRDVRSSRTLNGTTIVIPEEILMPDFAIELTEKGPDVSQKKSLISGTGVAYSSNTIEQDAAYWEVVVETAGPFRIGVARALKGGALAGSIGDEEKSWALASASCECSDGDVIGIAFGQAELPNLRFYRNGEELPKAEVQRVRGAVHPAVSVAGATKLRCVFDESQFKHEPPRGHTALRASQSLI